jgi:NTE family protein
MFGAYQAGAWRELSRYLKPDLIVGASVGALNGWLIASGVPAGELVEAWLDPASGLLMRQRARGAPWKSVFDPQPLRDRTQALTADYTPRTEFGVALLRLPLLRPVLARGAEVTWRHLVATCSIPGGFPPVRIGRAWYCDGGLLEAAPVWAATAMGADRAIVVNASRFVPPGWLRVLRMGSGLLRKSRSSPGTWPSATWITPNDPLGLLLDGAIWQKDKIERWIELGEIDARIALDGMV